MPYPVSSEEKSVKNMGRSVILVNWISADSVDSIFSVTILLVFISVNIWQSLLTDCIWFSDTCKCNAWLFAMREHSVEYLPLQGGGGKNFLFIWISIRKVDVDCDPYWLLMPHPTRRKFHHNPFVTFLVFWSWSGLPWKSIVSQPVATLPQNFSKIRSLLFDSLCPVW